MSKQPSALAQAVAVAAVPRRLSAALWAELTGRLELGGRGVQGLLGTLEEQGRLAAQDDDLVWIDPRRAELSRELARQQPQRWTLAHRTSARYFIERGSRGDLAEAIRHLMAVGERTRCQRLLGEWGLAALDRGDVPALLAATAPLRHGDAPVPPWLHVLEAAALERMGELSQALDRYDRFLHARGRGRLPRWVPAPTEICARAGLLAVRAGQLGRGERLLDRARALATDTRLAAIEQLAGRLDLGRGLERPAARHFRRAVTLAAAEGDAGAQVEALSSLGVIAMRTGEPLRAATYYRRALAHAAGGGGSDAQAARIQANLAMALATTGRWTEATAMFGEAIEHRQRLGDVAGAANSLAARAGAREGAGDAEGAWSDLVAARHRAAQADDPSLLLEVHLLRANLATRRRQGAEARAELQSALRVRDQLEHPDPLLEAMLAETQAELHLARRQFAPAAAAARRARRCFAQRGASFWVARLDLLLARSAFAAANNRAALRHLEGAARMATAAPFRFSGAWAWTDVLEFGAASGNALVRELCQASLGHGAPRGLPVHQDPGSGRLRILDRKGSRLATERAVDQLRDHPPPLLVDFPRQCLVVSGKRRSLGKRRILLPLLQVFLANPDRGLDAEQLHREVWGTDGLAEQGTTRLKVSISRLRQLVGRTAIETRTITTPIGGRRTLYGLRPTLDYAVIESG